MEFNIRKKSDFKEYHPEVKCVYFPYWENMDEYRTLIEENFWKNFPNVTKIILGGTNLEEIPNYVQNKNVKHLSMNKNKIKEIPSDLGEKMTNLEVLYLCSNNIDKIPVNFCKKMPNLTSLHLTDNNIDKIPIELFQIPNLLYLSINKNPITFTSEEIKKYSEINPKLNVKYGYVQQIVWQNMI